MGPVLLSGGSRHHVALGWVRHDEALTKMAAACWSRDRFTDVTIFCEDRALHAHRLVLASMSPLLGNLLSEAEGPDTALMLPEVKAEDMRLLLQFIYQGEVVLPPRRTAALLDLAAQLCVAGVRGGGNSGPTPPSPPRSDSPELDSCDRNESDHAYEDEPQGPVAVKNSSVASKHMDADRQDEGECGHPADDNSVMDEDSSDESGDEGPMNLAAKPEVKITGNVNCPRPKPCSSSPPDLNYFSKNQTHSSRTSFRLSDSRSSYYQHPALRGCHPFSLELAVRGSRTPEPKRYKRKLNYEQDNSAESDVEVTVDISVDEYDSDREIDLSLKSDINRLRPDSTGEEKLSPSSDLENSLTSNESIEQLKGRDAAMYMNPANAVADMRLSLADKMLLLSPDGPANKSDPRRTYLEAVLQESLVQQSYTIVLPSHLAVSSSLPMVGDQVGSASNSATLNGGSALEGKTWSSKNSSSELQCLQGLFNARSESLGRNSSTCDENSGPTNLCTNKNGNNSSCSSSSSNSKRNGKEGYSCQVCRKVFTSSSNLAVHSMIHSGTKPFKCDLCSWSFRQKAHLQKHMRHIHKIIVAK